MRKRDKFLKKAWLSIRHEVMTWPNLLTITRLTLVWPINYFITHKDYKMAVLLGLIAGLTDIFDGYLARRFNQVTSLGKAIDPFADKVYFIFIAWWLYPADLAFFWIGFMVFLEMVLIGLTALTAFAPEYAKYVELGANKFGKTKFCLQCILLILLLLNKSGWYSISIPTFKGIFMACYLLAGASIYGHAKKTLQKIAENHSL